MLARHSVCIEYTRHTQQLWLSCVLVIAIYRPPIANSDLPLPSPSTTCVVAVHVYA